jgi:hypothetical protein
VALPVQAPHLDRRERLDPLLRAVAAAERPAQPLGGLEPHVDRHLPVPGLVAPGLDLHAREVMALAERPLHGDQAVAVVRLAGPEPDETADVGRVEDLLVEPDGAERVTRPGVELDLDARRVGFGVHREPRGRERRVEVSVLGGNACERVLEGVVGRMFEPLAGRERKAVHELAHPRQVRAGTGHLHVDGGDADRRSRLHLEARLPGARAGVERVVDDRVVVAERLECLLDLAGRPCRQTAGLVLAHPSLPRGECQDHRAEDVALHVGGQAVDRHVDLDAVRCEHGRREHQCEERRKGAQPGGRAHVRTRALVRFPPRGRPTAGCGWCRTA